MGDTLLDAQVGGIEQRHWRRRDGCVFTQPAIEFEHRGEHVGCAGPAPGRAGTQSFLKHVVICDEGEVVQLAEVAPLRTALELLRYARANQHDRPAVLADVLGQAQPEIAISAIAILRRARLGRIARDIVQQPYRIWYDTSVIRGMQISGPSS
jgi:hypothetical protein